MNRLVWLLLLVGIKAYAQYSTVSATVTDSDAQTWNNGTYQATFVPPTGYNGTVYTLDGVAWTPSVLNGVLSGIGVLNAPNVPRNDHILPANSHWSFKICPHASVTCNSVTTVNVNAPTLDITSQLTLQTIRFPSAPTANSAFGYADVEVSPIPAPGGNYFNVNTGHTRQWNGSTWIDAGGGTPGPPGQQGPSGATGAPGPMGPHGPMGPQGPQGTNGATGTQGPMGPRGPNGSTGPSGAAGPAGAAGPMGPKGSNGNTGPAGVAGPQGSTGPTGPRGPQGPQPPMNGAPGQVTLFSGAPGNLILSGTNVLPIANSQPIESLMNQKCLPSIGAGYGLISNGSSWACGPIQYKGTTSDGNNGLNVAGTLKAGTQPGSPTSIGSSGVTFPDSSIMSTAPVLNQLNGYVALGGTNAKTVSGHAPIDYGVTTPSTLNIAANASVGSTTTPNTFYYSGDSPPKHPGTSNSADFMSLGCTNTVSSYFNGAGSTGYGGSHHYCLDFGVIRWSAPGINLGTTSPFGAQGWSVQTGLYLGTTANSPGITGALSVGQTKAGIGDNIASYLYENDYGGAVAGADEGMYALGLATTEMGAVYTGTIATSGGGTGATSLKVNCINDCGNPGDGRYLIDMNAPISGFVTAKTPPSGAFTPGTYSTDVSVTPSTFWCTLPVDVNTPQPTNPALAGVQATSMTFTCASGPGNVGAPAVNDQICFGGQFHEQSHITTVSGAASPWTITAPLRHTHEHLSWVVANGPCGTFIEVTANTIAPNAYGPTLPSQTIRYPIDILGAPDAHTLWWRQFTLSGAASNLPTNLHLADTTSGTISNSGGIVTMPTVTLTNGNYQFISYFNQPTITISGTGTAFDGQCTNTAANASGQLTCTQAASTGVGPVSTATIAIGTSQYGNGGFKLYKGAETLDVQTYTTSPPSVSPSNVTTFALEPNNAAWANADAVEQVHHYALQARTSRESEIVYNPMMFTTNVHSIGASGSGIRGGALTNPASNFSMFYITNGQTQSYYNYHGGVVMPPGGVYVEGLMNYGFGMHYAPDPIGMPAFYVGCPFSGCTDVNFNYSVFSLANPSGGTPATTTNLLFTPNTKVLQWQNGFMDFLSMPIYRPTIQSVSNGQPSSIKFNAIDSGGVSHVVNLTAPLTGTGGFTASLPVLTANSTLAITPGTQAWGLAVLVAGTVTISNTAACTPNGTTCSYQLTRCAPNASTGIGSLSVGTVVSSTSFVVNALSPTNTVLATDLSSICWRIN